MISGNPKNHKSYPIQSYTDPLKQNSSALLAYGALASIEYTNTSPSQPIMHPFVVDTQSNNTTKLNYQSNNATISKSNPTKPLGLPIKKSETMSKKSDNNDEVSELSISDIELNMDKSILDEYNDIISNQIKKQDASPSLNNVSEKRVIEPNNVNNDPKNTYIDEASTGALIAHAKKKDDVIDEFSLTLPLLPHVEAFSKARKHMNANHYVELPLPPPLKGFTLTSFSKEQMLAMPIAYTSKLKDVESLNLAKIAQCDFLNNKVANYSKNSKNALKRTNFLSATSCNDSNKKPKTHDIVYTGPAPDLPPGWRLVEKKRLNGKFVGTIDRWWYSPLTGKRFRSVVDTKRFLNLLEIVEGDEEEAFNIFKENKKKSTKQAKEAKEHGA